METRTNSSGLTDAFAARASECEDMFGLLREIERVLSAKPFRPHPLLRNGHAQTLAAYAWPRRFRLREHRRDEARLFEVEPGVKMLVHCRWHRDRRAHPALVLVHGLEGSSASVYMLGTSDKAFRAGFNVLRVNMRNCGGTEHLTPTLYHSGMSGDILNILTELVAHDRLEKLFLAGFSMGGNIALRVAAEAGSGVLPELQTVCAVSPALDLSACADAIERRSNWLYERSFIKNLRRRVQRKRKLFPGRYDTSTLRRVRTIRDFDELFTAVYGGFESAADYYARASALPLIPRIQIPTLIIHAQDDPFVPYESFCHPSIDENPHIVMLTPNNGGHVAFVADEPEGNDRFWAESRIVDFCRMVHSGTIEG